MPDEDEGTPVVGAVFSIPACLHSIPHFALLLIVALLMTLRLFAQQAQWNDLTIQAKQLFAEQKYDEALPLAREAFTIAETSSGPNQSNLLTSCDVLAAIYIVQKRYDEAEPLLTRIINIEENILGKDSPDLLTAFNPLVALYENEYKYAEAESLLLRSLAIQETVSGRIIQL